MATEIQNTPHSELRYLVDVSVAPDDIQPEYNGQMGDAPIVLVDGEHNAVGLLFKTKIKHISENKSRSTESVSLVLFDQQETWKRPDVLDTPCVRIVTYYDGHTYMVSGDTKITLRDFTKLCRLPQEKAQEAIDIFSKYAGGRDPKIYRSISIGIQRVNENVRHFPIPLPYSRLSLVTRMDLLSILSQTHSQRPDLQRRIETCIGILKKLSLRDGVVERSRRSRDTGVEPAAFALPTTQPPKQTVQSTVLSRHEMDTIDESSYEEMPSVTAVLDQVIDQIAYINSESDQGMDLLGISRPTRMTFVPTDAYTNNENNRTIDSNPLESVDLGIIGKRFLSIKIELRGNTLRLVADTTTGELGVFNPGLPNTGDEADQFEKVKDTHVYTSLRNLLTVLSIRMNVRDQSFSAQTLQRMIASFNKSSSHESVAA